MTQRPADVLELIARAWDLPDGPGQIAAAEEAIRRADALGDREVAFDARMLATSAYHRGGEPAKSFVTFSWCLADYDADPGRHDAIEAGMLRWFFKYVVSSLPKFPEIPLERTHAVLDDMEHRFRDGGHSMHAVYNLRWLLARHVGDERATDEWYARWCAAARDENSDCAGCDPTEKVMHLHDRGRDDEAVALAEPVLAGHLTCSEQPQSMLTELLVPYVRTGRLVQARDAHRRAYRALRGNVANLVDVAAHVTFCALTGNEARGLEVVERHVDWLDRAPSPYAAMEFAASAALVLRRLVETGHGDLTVHRRGGAEPRRDGDQAARQPSVRDLGRELTDLATTLAARFDARNGTGHQSVRIARRLAAEPIVEHLPLSATARSRSGPPSPAPPSDPVPADATAEELLDLVDEYTRTDRWPDAAAALRAFDERVSGADLPPVLVARRADAQGRELAERSDLAGAETAWRTAATGYREAGDELRAQGALGRLGVLLCLAEPTGVGLALVEESSAYVSTHGPPDVRAAAHARLGIALHAAGRAPDALAAFDLAVAAAGEAGDPYLTGHTALRRAHCLADMDRPEDFRAEARRARDLYRTLGGDGLAIACLLYGTSLEADAADDAVAAFDEAVRAASPGAASLDPRLARGRALCAVDRPADAIDDFVEAVALCTELGIADGAAFTRYELAGAYRQAGRFLEAAEAAEEAVTALTALGAQEAADRSRYLLSGIYHDLGEDDAALALLDQLAANLDGFDNLPTRGQVYEEAGDLLYRIDRDAVAAARFAAAAAAFARAGLPVDELRARRRHALALRWAGELDAAVAALAEADRVAARLPGEPDQVTLVTWERAMLGYDAAKVLIGADRLDEALPRISGVPGALRSIEAFGEAFLAELLLGELLLRMDRPAEAEPVLRAVLAGLPRDADPLPQAAWLLAEALVQLGRDDEAAELRHAYELDDDTD